MQYKSQIFIIVFLLIFSSIGYADKSYRIKEVVIKAQLEANGNMEVSECRTYDFQDNFSYAFRTFPTSGPVAFFAFELTENNQPYKLSDSEEPGTYWIREKDKHTEVRWFFRAQDEERTFTIRYSVKDAVVRYQDATVLHYQFISAEWAKPSWNVSLTLEPPIPLSSQQVKVWAHGPLWMESFIQEDGTITGSCKKVPASTYFDIRALYPSQIFPQSKFINKAVNQTIMKEEAEWALEANQRRERLVAREERRAQGKWIMGFLSVMGFLGWLSLYRRYGTRPSLQLPVPEVSPNIPSDTPPALLDYLLHNREIYSGALMGTLFDLARKGILKLRQEERKVEGWKKFFQEKFSRYWDINREEWKNQTEHLTEYENDLLEFLFNTIGQGGDSLDIKLLGKKRSAFMKFFQKWKKLVKKKAEEKGWFDRQSIKGKNFSFILAGVLFLLSIPGFILYGPWGLILSFSSSIIFILSLFIVHRTREAEYLARQWKSLNKYLHKHRYHNADRELILGWIDAYLVYGVVLGLTKKIIKELAEFIPPDHQSQYIPWFIYRGGPGTTFSSDSFATSFSATIAATTSAMSSASGSGGGASGGAGGASSGGGGAG